ncbi:MAG: leucine-rich repeat domain-containing protein [Bacteroidota bacterium]|nr:leucine-rich repeat domain-containing protein [Bacteroidota bacterium]
MKSLKRSSTYIFSRNILLRSMMLIIMGFCSSAVSAQSRLLDSLTLDTLRSFTSLEEALKNPDKVIKLELRRKKYKTFPKEIFKFRNLQYLDLSKNSIAEIPPEIEQLKDLQYFSISKNGLEEFPAQMGELSNLYYLNANQNNLTGIPVSFGKLSKLKNLDLWSNNIERFPEELKYMKSLMVMDLRVILIPDAEQDRIQAMLPHTKVYFSPYCKCQQ